MFERLRFYLRHSLNDLRINRQRTFFALLCIAAGVAAVVSLQTLAVMMDQTLKGSLQESNRGDIRLVPEGGGRDGYTQEVESTLGTNGVVTPRGMTALREWLDARAPGASMTYRLALTGFGVGNSVSIPSRDTDKQFVMNFVIEAARYPLYGRVRSQDGRELADLLHTPTDIVLSENLAEELEAQVGDSLRISGATQDFTVRGIVPADSEAGFQNFLAGLLGYYYLDVSAVSLFTNVEPQQVNEVYIRLSDPGEVERLAQRLRIAFHSFDVNSTVDLAKQNELLSEVVDRLVVVMGLISLLIGGIGIINTMLVIVSRRSAEVAVLKTLGLEPRAVTILFLCEALLMGVFGSLAGIVLGWGLVYLAKGIAENFLGQSLAFTLAPVPALNGFVIGLIITAIFGFLPTLAAGQIRPASVLRPSETLIPKAGRLSALVAVVVLILALSLLVQSLLGDLLAGVKNLESITAAVGAVYGLAMAVPLLVSRALSMRERRRGRRWALFVPWALALLMALPVLGALFGYAIPALVLLTGTAVLVGYLYITFWLIIWAAGGGALRDLWPGALALAFPLFWPLIPVLIVLLIPIWLLGRLIQRHTFPDFKIAMRSMLATKGRGASTLLALVVGIFTLSVITMLVKTVTNAFSTLLEEGVGGNVLILTAGGSTDTVQQMHDKLAAGPAGVRGFAAVGTFNAQLQQYYDDSAGRDVDNITRGRLRAVFSSLDGREISSNLPKLDFIAGRNLDPRLDNQPDAEGVWPAVVKQGDYYRGFEIGVGDRLTFALSGGHLGSVTFRVVGVARQSDVNVTIGSNANLYAPLGAFEGQKATALVAVADVEEGKIRTVRRSLAEIPGTFVLETRFLNDLVNRITDQFSSFPTLIAALALFTGGVVIANSVALSTMERRREIGIMKAIGVQRERVLGILLLENGLIGLIGGLIGVGISFILMLILLAQLFEGQLGKAIPYGIAFLLMGLCLAIALVAAILSVWSASGEKPLNTLRYE